MPVASWTERPASGLSKRFPVAVALCSALPIVLIGYLASRHIFPAIDPREPATAIAVALVVLGTVLAVAAGGFMIASLGRVAATAGAAVKDLEERGAEVRSLMDSVARLVATIEHQQEELTRYQTRLDEAYRDLETTTARMRETSFKDEVTGLYNRRFFTVRLEEELSRHRRFNHPVSVVLFDLDGFKEINDELGHGVGDETLRDIGQILMKHSRGINVVSRYGGDEFAILLVETSKAGASLYADRIRQVISGHPYSHGKRVTASFGVASLPDDEAVTSEDLFRVADEALYAAKRAGKNQVAVAGSGQGVS